MATRVSWRCGQGGVTGAHRREGWAYTLTVAFLLIASSGCRPPIPPPDAGVDAGPTGPRDGVSIMTWNLESFPLTSGTITNVNTILSALDPPPDLIAVQEIADQEAFEAMAEAMPDYDGIIANDPNAFIAVGLLYRNETVNIGRVRTLFADNGWAFPRPPLAVWLTVSDGGGFVSFDLTVVVVHLKALFDDDSQERRRLGCEHLLEWLDQQVATGPEDDIIILGDWNDQLDDPVQWNVFQSILDRSDDYTFLTLGMSDGGAYTYIPFESFIDHVLISNQALEEYGQGVTRVLALEHTYPNYRTHVSDHRPIITTFEVP